MFSAYKNKKEMQLAHLRTGKQQCMLCLFLGLHMLLTGADWRLLVQGACGWGGPSSPGYLQGLNICHSHNYFLLATDILMLNPNCCGLVLGSSWSPMFSLHIRCRHLPGYTTVDMKINTSLSHFLRPHRLSLNATIFNLVSTQQKHE